LNKGGFSNVLAVADVWLLSAGRLLVESVRSERSVRSVVIVGDVLIVLSTGAGGCFEKRY